MSSQKRKISLSEGKSQGRKVFRNFFGGSDTTSEGSTAMDQASGSGTQNAKILTKVDNSEVFKSGPYTVKLLQRSSRKYFRFNVNYTYFDVNIYEDKSDPDNSSRLIDIIEIVKEGLSQSLKRLQHLFKEDIEYQFYQTIVDETFMDTSQDNRPFNLKSNPDILADIICTRLK
jgi:hypothetical protein